MCIRDRYPAPAGLRGANPSGIPSSAVLPLAELLFACDERELHLDAVDLLAKHADSLSVRDLPVLERILATKSWWDTVDLIASSAVGSIVLGDSTGQGAKVMDTWIASPNLWIRRSAIIHQLKFKKATDEERLLRYVRRCMHEREFFITKAIGWALRQHARLQPLVVQEFVREHEEALASLSKREALKHCGSVSKAKAARRPTAASKAAPSSAGASAKKRTKR
eukprot:TRINITY_DN50115_c0_g1_i1.p2 TRINITY_DN50115_c0_g1~~TRINITY_DN50115_c0_g1_i1.p2  ORF type:complete len:223 (+),score=54.51 TRINITY_DN50115_c0_g1_i1:90-758(+)